TALGCYRMLRETFGYAAGPALTGTALAGLQALMLARAGMETTLALPLIFAAIIALGRFLAAPRFASAAAASGLAAAAILARLDAAILFALLGVAALEAFRARLGEVFAPPALAGIALGTLPLAAYLGANVVFFGAMMPVSGQAKQLADGFFLNPTGFIWFAWTIQQIALLRPLNPIFVLTAIPLLAIGAMLALARVRETIPASGRAPLVHALVGCPLVYFAVIGLISDWGLWIWYMYPVVPATAIAAAGAAHALTPRAGARCGWRGVLPVAAILASLAIIAHEAPRSPAQGRAILGVSRALAAFAAAHPGRYAMGDRAGTFAFLTDQPVVQLE